MVAQQELKLDKQGKLRAEKLCEDSDSAPYEADDSVNESPTEGSDREEAEDVLHSAAAGRTGRKRTVTVIDKVSTFSSLV